MLHKSPSELQCEVPITNEGITWSCMFPQVELGLLLFLNTLAVEARSKAFEEKSATIRAQHLMAVSKVGLSGVDASMCSSGILCCSSPCVRF